MKLLLPLLLQLSALSLGLTPVYSRTAVAFPSKNVQIFFYAWYGAPPTDVGYLHWTHSVLPHWTPSVNDQYRAEPYIAPHDPGVTYYPLRGLHSSNDLVTLTEQMAEIADAGIDTVLVSWWGQRYKNTSIDGQGVGSDHCVPNILAAAAAAGVSVGFHLEPYERRGIYQIRDDIEYIYQHYGNHTAFYRHPVTGQGLLYIYDSYHWNANKWAMLLTVGGTLSIRNTSLDSIVVGLVLDDTKYLIDGGFDGAYSYFATDGFTAASTTGRWQEYSERLADAGLFFVPSVAPGYDDTRLRQWNTANKRARQRGEYYNRMWLSALAIPNIDVVSITSFNEWGEGSQIEPAKSFVTDKGVTLLGYSEDASVAPEQDSHLYLSLTKELATQFKSTSGNSGSRDGDSESSHRRRHRPRHTELR